MKELYEKYMLFVSCLGSTVYFAQAIKIVLDESAINVSLFGFTIGFISVASWLIYGFQLRNKVVIFSNMLATIGAFAVVVAILIFS